MEYIIIVGIVAIIVVAIIYTFMVRHKIKKEGIETEGVVSRIEESESYDSDTGAISTTYTYYVLYKDQNGSEIEARLANPKNKLKEGSKLKMKYLPTKPKFVLLTEIIEI